MISSARRSPPPASAREAIVGHDPSLSRVLARAALVAPTQTPLLITGESGTGKELLARLVHELGPRPQGPFLAVNCGALSRELAESELFGHERGAFTGAAGSRLGWFGEASGGTLVLDEIGELPLDLQPKLLRVLETGRVRRVGGTGDSAVAVRVVAMTLRNLRRESEEGAFRLDLYHRLAGFELLLPPLRTRPTDIPRLVGHFLAEIEPEVGRREVEPEAMAALAAYPWPGNVRELRNVVRKAAILTGARIDRAALELEPLLTSPPSRGGYGSRAAEDQGTPPPLFAEDTLGLTGKTFLELERDIFAWAMRRTGGSRRQAALALGISRSTFCDRVKRLRVVP